MVRLTWRAGAVPVARTQAVMLSPDFVARRPRSGGNHGHGGVEGEPGRRSTRSVAGDEELQWVLGLHPGGPAGIEPGQWRPEAGVRGDVKRLHPLLERDRTAAGDRAAVGGDAGQARQNVAVMRIELRTRRDPDRSEVEVLNRIAQVGPEHDRHPPRSPLVHEVVDQRLFRLCRDGGSITLLLDGGVIGRQPLKNGPVRRVQEVRPVGESGQLHAKPLGYRDHDDQDVR